MSDSVVVRMSQSRNGELSKKLYVGNLPFTTTDTDLRDAFEKHGGIVSANVITDRETGRSRGFGFVEFDDPGGAETALREMNGADLGGRTLRVNEAFDRRGGGGGGGDGGGGGGGRRDRY